MLRKLPIVGVFGQGTPVGAERARLARAAGAMVARLGAHLLTGAGYGVMEAVAEGFVAVDPRPGLSIGIVPRATDGPLNARNRAQDGRAYPNPSVEIAIYTPLPPRSEDWRTTPARNHINVFTPEAIIALPGGSGTRNELDMVAYYRGESALARPDRRVLLLGPIEEFSAEHRELFGHAASLADAERHLARVITAHGFAKAET